MNLLVCYLRTIDEERGEEQVGKGRRNTGRIDSKKDQKKQIDKQKDRGRERMTIWRLSVNFVWTGRNNMKPLQVYPFFHEICCMHRCAMCVRIGGWIPVCAFGMCICVCTPTDRIGWWWFEMEFGLCVIMIIHLYALPAYHIISSLSKTTTHSITYTHPQKQIESSKIWLFTSNDFDVDGLRWCADLFVIHTRQTCACAHMWTLTVYCCFFIIFTFF